MNLEREYQNKLDRITRVNDETYTCESCAEEFDSDGMCEHDSNIHTFCNECCENIYMPDERREPMEWNDLD